MRKNKLEGKIPGSGRPSNGRGQLMLYLDADIIDKLKEIRSKSNDLLNEKLRELLK